MLLPANFLDISIWLTGSDFLNQAVVSSAWGVSLPKISKEGTHLPKEDVHDDGGFIPQTDGSFDTHRIARAT